MISEGALRGLCRALSGAIKSGLPLTSAFEKLSGSREYGKFLERAAALTAQGRPIHEAFSAQKAFPPVFTALLRAGEEGGKTAEFLDLYADSLDVRIDFRRRVGRAFIYPAFAALLAAGLFIAFTVKALPLLLGPQSAPPAWFAAVQAYAARFAALTAARQALSLAAAAAVFFALRALLRTAPCRKFYSLCAHRLPGLRYATEEARLYYVYTTLGLLLKAGFPLTAMMEVMLQFSHDDPVLTGRFAQAAGGLARGYSFSRSLQNIFPPDDLRAVDIAEGAGRLEETLLRLAQEHRALHLHRLKVLVTSTTIATTAALAPLCFLLVLSVLRQAQAALGAAVSAGGQQQAPLRPGAAPEPAQEPPAEPPAALRRIPEEDGSVSARTSDFNTVQGGEIMRLMSRSPKKAAAADDGGERPAVVIPKMKKRAGGIVPARIDPARVSSGQ